VTRLEILGGFFGFVLGKSASWTANWAKDAAVGSIKRPARELNRQLRAATEQWRQSLPDDLRGADFDPQQFWNPELAIDPKHEAERELAVRLWNRDVPPINEFFLVLKNRYQKLQDDATAPGRYPPAFFAANAAKVEARLKELVTWRMSARLSSSCTAASTSDSSTSSLRPRTQVNRRLGMSSGASTVATRNTSSARCEQLSRLLASTTEMARAQLVGSSSMRASAAASNLSADESLSSVTHTRYGDSLKPALDFTSARRT